MPVIDGTPDPSVFSESEMGEELMEVLGDEKVECVLNASTGRDFVLIRVRDIFRSFCGQRGDPDQLRKRTDFEVELELFSGETEAAWSWGNSCRKNTAWKYRNSANMQEASN